MKILPPLRTLFEKHNLLAPDVLFAMVLKYLIYGRRLLEKPELQDLLLSLITEAAKQGNVPARAIIYRVHEYFGRKTCRGGRESQTGLDFQSNPTGSVLLTQRATRTKTRNVG